MKKLGMNYWVVVFFGCLIQLSAAAAEPLDPSIRWSVGLLSLSDKTEGESFTVREIDRLIHHLYPYSPVSSQEHLAHQITLLSITRGHEREVFNDPSVRYPGWRPHLSGETGTMSNILTSSFFYLYWQLIEMGLRIDPEADFKVMHQILMSMNFEQDLEDRFTLSIPPEEYRSFRQVLHYLNQLNPGSPLLTSAYWDRVIHQFEYYIAHCSAEAESTWEFWQTNPHQRRISTFMQWTRCSVPVPEYLDFAHNYSRYEYFPSYLNHDTLKLQESREDVSRLLPKLKLMRAMYLAPDSVRNREENR